MSMLQIANLTVCFGKARAVDGISFEIRENEVVGLVGESGSGKTITGYAITGILPKEANIEGGSIKFEGKEILHLPDKDLLDIRGSQIGIVFQEPFTSLNPVIRIGHQIEEAIITHKRVSKDETKRKTMALLEKVKLNNPERIYYDYPHQLSGGERQRAMIAMAIALNPKLLIADEPTTALDVTIQSEILKLLKDLKREFKLSILFITHDFSIIDEMADRVLVMKEGKIVETGPKNEILTTPKHDYTKKLINAVPKIDANRKPLTANRETFLEARNLCKSFPTERGAFRKEVARIEAVKHVNIKIEQGKTLGLVGESGCGKSTLGRLILGLEEPDSGEVIVKNNVYKKYPIAVRKMLQIVFQDPYSSLDPRMRMSDIVLEGVNLLGSESKNKQTLLQDLLSNVQLSYSDRFKYPHQFSGGQRQRIAIARALAVKPEFIVLDEPVSSLDVLIQRDILNLLKNLKKDFGLTYLFISHDPRIIESMSDDVCVMHKGEIKNKS